MIGTIKRPVSHAVILVLALVILLMSVGTTVSYAASNPVMDQTIVDDTKEGYGMGFVNQEAERLDLDMEDTGWLDGAGANIGYMLASLTYKISRGLGYYGAYLVEFAAKFNLVEKVEKFFSPLFGNLEGFTMREMTGHPGSGKTIGIGILFIAFTMILVVVQIIRGQIAGGVGRMAQLIGIMLLAMLFFSNPTTLMENGSTIAHDIGTGVFAYATDDVSTDKHSRTVEEAAAVSVWDIMAAEPWLALEFGDMDDLDTIRAGNGDEGAVYKASPGKDRETPVDNLITKNKDKYRYLTGEWSAQSDRLGSAAMFALMNCVIFIMLAGISLITLIMQALAIILSLIAPFVFLLALFPTKGFEVIKKWFMAILAAYLGVALALFGMGIFLLIINTVYSALVSTLGMLFSFIVILAFVAAIWMFRRSIFGIFADTSTMNRLESRAHRQLGKAYMRQQRHERRVEARRENPHSLRNRAADSKLGTWAQDKYNNNQRVLDRQATKQAKREDAAAKQSDRQRSIDNQAEFKRKYHSVDEVKKAKENLHDYQERERAYQDQQRENLRERVRKRNQQQSAGTTGAEAASGGQASQGKRVRRDANGIPYVAGSKYDVQQQKNQEPMRSAGEKAEPEVKTEGLRHTGAHSNFNLYDEKPVSGTNIRQQASQRVTKQAPVQNRPGKSAPTGKQLSGTGSVPHTGAHSGFNLYDSSAGSQQAAPQKAKPAQRPVAKQVKPQPKVTRKRA